MLCGDPKMIGAPIKKGGWDYEYPDYGLINIHTKSKSQGTVLTFSQSAGNETGDPGPYAYTKYKSPNVLETA